MRGIQFASVALVLVFGSGAFADEKVDKWVQKLTAEKPEERTEAAFALGAMGEKAADSVDGLRKTLRDKFFKVRAASAIALGKIGPKVGNEATIDLLELLDDMSPSVRRAAAKALGRLGEEPARRAVEALTKDLDHKKFKVRQSAADTLGSMGLTAQSALEKLQAMAKDDKSKTARAAAEGAAAKIAAAVEAEAERKRQEEEAKKKAEEEAKKLAAAEADARKKAEEEAKKKAEEEAKKKAAEEAKKISCPACEEKNDPKATNCSGCGDPIVGDKQGTRECPGCGQKINDAQAKTCPDCETELPAESAKGDGADVEGD